jgi:HlyD family secretion protein
MKRRIIIIGLLVALGIAGGLLWRSSTERRDGSLFYGNVDIRDVNLGFRVSGRVARMLKDEGDVVKAGETLAELDRGPYEHRLAQAEAQLAARQAANDLKQHGFRVEEIAEGQAVVNERLATLQNAQIELNRQKELVSQKAVSQQDFDRASATYREANARYNSAVQSFQLLNAGFRKEETAQAQAELEQARAAVEIAKTDLSDTVLVAAEAGIVMTRAVEPGAIVQAGATIYTVNLQNPVWVRAYVSEPFLGRVVPGAQVEVTSDLHPDKPFHGQIGYVSPRAEFTPKSVETTDLRSALVYRFRVVVADANDDLRQGMPVTVRLLDK